MDSLLLQTVRPWLDQLRTLLVATASDWLGAAVRNLLRQNTPAIAALLLALTVAVLVDALRGYLLATAARLLLGAARLLLRFGLVAAIVVALFPHLNALLAGLLFVAPTPGAGSGDDPACTEYWAATHQNRELRAWLLAQERPPTATEEQALAALERLMRTRWETCASTAAAAS